MMCGSTYRLVLLTGAAFFFGQSIGGAGSARAAKPQTVAADLVELAIAIPDAASRLKILENELERVTQLRGVASRSEVERVRIEHEAARQKLTLLHQLVHAELDITAQRAALARERREREDHPESVEERAAKLRLDVLQLMLRAARVEQPEREDETLERPKRDNDATSQEDHPRVERHVTVFQKYGQFAGWPANHGMWMWGEEMLVGFSIGAHKDLGEERHNIDRDKPEYHVLARSLDGGVTWNVEYPNDKGMLINAGGMRHGTMDPSHSEPDPAPITEPIDFTHPDFCMTLRFADVNGGNSRLYYSYDRGRNWRGPFLVPSFGQKGVMARTDYIVNGPRDCHIFLTAAKPHGTEGRVFCARTTDGGVNWEFLSYVGPEPNGFSIMPSSVRLSPEHLVMTTRRRAAADEPRRRWIDTWASHNNGRSWEPLGNAVNDVGEGNPPSMLQLQDGRLCVTYGVRKPPFEMQAKFSSDAGRSWSEPFVLQTNGGGRDLGYSRTLQRPDGKLVTVYYFYPDDDPYRRIIATIWDPGTRSVER
jgi:hypothetical protein